MNNGPTLGNNLKWKEMENTKQDKTLSLERNGSKSTLEGHP